MSPRMRTLTAALLLAGLAACSGSQDQDAPVSAADPQSTQLAGAIQADRVVDEQIRTVLNPPVDTTKKLEYVDLEVDLAVPSSSRPLALYILKPEEWTLVKMDLVSATQRRYRFQRVAGTNGRALPDVDPLRPR